jgi:hypothetical protein
MSRDSLEKLGLIGATVVATAMLAVGLGLTFPPGDLWNPLGIAGLLAAGAWYYRRQGTDAFVLCLTALLHVTLYTACYSTLMYAVGAIGRPFVDDALVACDAALGCDVASIQVWAERHSTINAGLQLAYNSLLWQTPLVIVVLGFGGDRLKLEGFVRQFMLSTLACAAVFAAWPGEGPFAAYGYAPSASQSAYLDHLHALRDGTRTLITWRGAEGLITFPSFHTCWAILLAWALRGRGWLTVAAVLLNAAVIVSTLTTGWHYGTDVIGGGVTAVLAIAASEAWAARTVSSPMAATWPEPLLSPVATR